MKYNTFSFVALLYKRRMHWGKNPKSAWESYGYVCTAKYAIVIILTF